MVDTQTAETPFFSRDAGGAPIPALGNYGPSQDTVTPLLDETGGPWSLSASAFELTHPGPTSLPANGDYGLLEKGGIYQIRVAATAPGDIMYYRWQQGAIPNPASPPGPPVATTSDTFWPIGRLPIWTFKCLPGQEELSILLSAARSLCIVRLR